MPFAQVRHRRRTTCTEVPLPAIAITDEQVAAKARELGLVKPGVPDTDIPARVRTRAKTLLAREQLAEQRPAPKSRQVDGRRLAANTRAVYAALVDEGFTEAQALAICGNALSRHVI